MKNQQPRKPVKSEPAKSRKPDAVDNKNKRVPEGFNDPLEGVVAPIPTRRRNRR